MFESREKFDVLFDIFNIKSPVDKKLILKSLETITNKDEGIIALSYENLFDKQDFELKLNKLIENNTREVILLEEKLKNAKSYKSKEKEYTL